MEKLLAVLDWLDDQYKVIFSASIVAGFAAFVKAVHAKMSWRQALADGLLAFVLGGASASLLSYYFGLPTPVVGGICALIGLLSNEVMAQLRRLIAASGAAAVKKVRP